MSTLSVNDGGLKLGTIAVIVAALSLFFNDGFTALMDASGMGTLIALAVLGVSGLAVMAVRMDRSWWPNLFYLAGLLYSPTAVGLSKADWFTWVGLPGGVPTFASELPDVVCLAVGAVIVAAYLLACSADRLGDIGESLVAEGALASEVDKATSKGFAELSVWTWALAAGTVVIWLVGGVLSGLFSGAAEDFLLIGLVSGSLMVILFYWIARSRLPSEGDRGAGRKE